MSLEHILNSDGKKSSLSKLRVIWMLIDLDHKSDWYSLHRVTRKQDQVHNTFTMINFLRGQLMDLLESGELE